MQPVIEKPALPTELRSLVQQLQAVLQQYGYAINQLGKTPEVIAPTLLNSWVNFGSVYLDAGYYKDSLGRVHLQGLIKNGTVPNNAFVLPVGYRPSARLIFNQMASDVTATSYVFDRVDVLSDGGVNIIGYAPAGSSAPAWVSLNGISFLANGG